MALLRSMSPSSSFALHFAQICRPTCIASSKLTRYGTSFCHEFGFYQSNFTNPHLAIFRALNPIGNFIAFTSHQPASFLYSRDDFLSSPILPVDFPHPKWLFISLHFISMTVVFHSFSSKFLQYVLGISWNSVLSPFMIDNLLSSPLQFPQPPLTFYPLSFFTCLCDLELALEAFSVLHLPNAFLNDDFYDDGSIPSFLLLSFFLLSSYRCFCLYILISNKPGSTSLPPLFLYRDQGLSVLGIPSSVNQVANAMILQSSLTVRPPP